MTCTTCGAIIDTRAPSCPLCGAANPATATAAGTPTAGTEHGAPGAPGAFGASGGAGPAGGAGALPPPPPPSGTPAWPAPQAHPSGLSSESRGWAIAAHLGGLLVFLASAAVFGFGAPLLVWLFKRDDDPYIEHHSKEALNFQLTVLVVILLGLVLAIPAMIIGVLTLGIGLVVFGALALVAMVAWIVLPIIGAVKASNGEGYRYPFTIRFVS